MMKSKTVLVTSPVAATFGLVSLVDTAGVLPFQRKQCRLTHKRLIQLLNIIFLFQKIQKYLKDGRNC